MHSARRIPSWLLIVATAAICVGHARAGIGRLLSTVAVRRSVEPRSTAKLSRRAGHRGGERSARAVAHAGRSRPGRSCDGILPNKREHGEEWEREGSVSVLRERQAHLRIGRRRAYPWRRKPHHGSRGRDSGCISGANTVRAKLPPGVFFSPRRAACAPDRGARRRAA